MKLKVFIAIICIQIVAIIFIFLQINQKNSTTLGISVNTIDSNTIQKTVSEGLKYFYEPKANTTEEVNKDWLSYVPKYTINNDTLNERFDYDVQKKQGVFRIITLGDSFTFGENVDTKDNYSEQLEDLLKTKCSKNKFEVINLGVRGYDIQYMNERFKKRGVKYKPDLVIMLFGDFQLFRLNEELGKRVEKMKKINPDIDESTAHINSSKEMISYLGWNFILNWQISQIDHLVSSIDSKKLIIKFPVSCNENQYNWYTQSFECWPFIRYNNLFKEASLKRKDTYFLNDFEWKRELSLQDGHPNKEGHKVIAEDIFQYLTKNKVIPCSP